MSNEVQAAASFLEQFTEDGTQLEHHGVKGQKWGIRKAEGGGSGGSEPKAERKPLTRNQKLAIAGTAATAVVGIAVLGVALRNHGNVKLEDVADNAKKFDDIFKATTDAEPTGIIFNSRGKNLGHRFLMDGGIGFEGGFSQMVKSGGTESNIDDFTRFGDNLEKVRSSFLDPEGRTDRAGRAIMHDLVIPAGLSKDINSVEDVKKKIWPMVSEAYDKFYEESLK
jgi:hypothetical protein